VPDNPNWVFSVQLGSKIYNLRGLWNDRSSRWTLSILTDQNEPLVVGEPINLNWPLFFGSQDERLPRGKIFVISLSGRGVEDPGRDAFSEIGGYSMVFVGEE
jgi:hypothetical protein